MYVNYQHTSQSHMACLTYHKAQPAATMKGEQTSPSSFSPSFCFVTSEKNVAIVLPLTGRSTCSWWGSSVMSSELEGHVRSLFPVYEVSSRL